MEGEAFPNVVVSAIIPSLNIHPSGGVSALLNASVTSNEFNLENEGIVLTSILYLFTLSNSFQFAAKDVLVISVAFVLTGVSNCSLRVITSVILE